MSLKYRLFALSFGAPLLLTLIYTGYLLFQDSQQRLEILQARMDEHIEILSPSLVEALNRNDRDTIESLAQRLLDIGEVQAVTIRQAHGAPLLQIGSTQQTLDRPLPEQVELLQSDGPWRLIKPLPVNSSPGDSRGSRGIRYWIDLTISDAEQELLTYRQLANHALAWLIMALLLLALAYITQRRLFPALAAQREALARLDSGEYEYRLPDSGPQELIPLSHAINAIGQHLQHNRDNMRQQIEQTTADLQESMETIEIQNIELDMARRRAQQANRIKSEFLANMSHEIRTPLNGIIGFCRLIGRSRLDGRQREWLGHIETASDNLLSLLNDILDFSKIEAGKLELETVPLDMVTLVDEVLVLQAPASQQKDLQLLGLVYDDVPPELLGDPLRIKQVLTNLVHNAVKFTEHGEVIVRVSVEEADDGRMLLGVKVSDTGIGLSNEVQQQLFQPFSQGAAARSRQYGGSGLGLMICKQLIEQMGGNIGVYSRPGQGSEFSFRLPLQVVGTYVERPLELELANPSIALYEPHGATRQALHHLLERWGARVRLIESAEAPIPEDLDLLVANMSRIDLQHWNQRLAETDCPVLALVNANPYDLTELKLPTGSDILSKPFSRAKLAEFVKRLLSSNTAPSTAPEPAPSAPLSHQPRVLVVDDIPSNRLLVKELLGQAGATALLAESGEEALALAHEITVDLILMDIRMPGMNGVEAMQGLRRLGGDWTSCPCVALTAHALEEETEELREAGMQEVLIKPLDESSLAKVLETYLALEPRFVPIGRDSQEEDELPVVDMELGRTMAGGNPELARDTLEMLLDSLDASESALRKAYAGKDPEALLDAVHHLNGACRYSGVPQLALLCETLETRLRAHGMQAVDDMLAAVFAAMQRLRDWHALQTAQ